MTVRQLIDFVNNIPEQDLDMEILISNKPQNYSTNKSFFKIEYFNKFTGSKDINLYEEMRAIQLNGSDEFLMIEKVNKDNLECSIIGTKELKIIGKGDNFTFVSGNLVADTGKVDKFYTIS